MGSRTVSFDQATMRIADAGSGLWVSSGTPPTMPAPHRHNDVEVNYVVQGSLDYQFGGETIQFHAGTIAIFWAALPHRLLDTSAGEAFWIHIPLNSVLAWPLSKGDIKSLLRMRPLTLLEDQLPYDALRMFTQWQVELVDPPRSPIAEIEAQGLIRRILTYRIDPPAGVDRGMGFPQVRLQHAAALSRFVADSYREPLTASGIATEVGLSPNYAMTTFKEVTGMTLGKYITWCRVSEAQRLLLTTDLSVSDVGAEAGFSSTSSFYSHFTQECGVSPGKYRSSVAASA